MCTPDCARSGRLARSFLVEWLATEPVNAPVVEAVMIGTARTQGISFVTEGRVIRDRSKAGEGGPGSVHFDLQLRQVHALGEIGVLDLPDALDAPVQVAGHGLAFGDVAALDLHLDRRHRPGIEDAPDHAAGLEKEVVSRV